MWQETFPFFLASSINATKHCRADSQARHGNARSLLAGHVVVDYGYLLAVVCCNMANSAMGADQFLISK
jgi:hypothetical protein